MERIKQLTRFVIVAFAACIALHANAGNDGVVWKRNLMDGSRTGCTVPMLTGLDKSIGTVKGRVYYAPNGRVYKGGNAGKVAGLILGAQPSMAPVKVPVGHSAKMMMKYYPESPLSNFFVDVLMKETERVAGKKVDVGLGNFGGIRVDMPEGEIIMDDIMSMFPFRNDIVYLTIRGTELRELFGEMAERGFQVLGGVRIVAENKRLVSVEVGGEPLDDDRLYGMATISFLLDGGDGISLRKRADELFCYPVSIFDAVMNYIKVETAAGRSLDSDTDGRVVILDMPEEKAEASFEYGVLTDSPVSDGKYFKILHTNDTHSHIDPVRGGVSDGLGGVIERTVYIDSVRNAVGKRNMLLLDAGDFSQGTSYFTILNGDLEVELMNAMGYDVACLGNHEFDNGLEELARRLEKADFEVVCSNYDFTGTALEKFVKPYTIVRRAGRKIGIFGLLNNITRVVDRSIADQLSYEDPVVTAERYAGYLKEEKGCDIVICLSHLGFSGADSDCSVAAGTTEVDMIIGGHSHTDLEDMVVVKNADGDDVIIVQDGSWGLHVGNFDID